MMYQSDAFRAVQGGINTFGGLFFGPVFNTTTGIPVGFPGAGTPINLITGELGFGVGGAVALQLDGTFADDAWGNINNFDSHRLPSNWIGNNNITWYSPDNHWQVTGFVRNFTDSRAQNSAFDLAIVDGSDEQSFEKPRRYGVTLRYNY